MDTTEDKNKICHDHLIEYLSAGGAVVLVEEISRKGSLRRG